MSHFLRDERHFALALDLHSRLGVFDISVLDFDVHLTSINVPLVIVGHQHVHFLLYLLLE